MAEVTAHDRRGQSRTGQDRRVEEAWKEASCGARLFGKAHAARDCLPYHNYKKAILPYRGCRNEGHLQPGARRSSNL